MPLFIYVAAIMIRYDTIDGCGVITLPLFRAFAAAMLRRRC